MRKIAIVLATTALFSSCTLYQKYASKEVSSAPAEPPILSEPEKPQLKTAETAPEPLDNVKPDAHIDVEAPIAKAHKIEVPIDDLIPKTSYIVLGPKNAIPPLEQTDEKQIADELCREIGAKLGSVNESDCLRHELIATQGRSVQGREMAIKAYPPKRTREPMGRVLVIGGIHGDEFSSVSVVFKWMDILDKHHSGLFHWRFIPASNPDGLLNKKSQRQNANGVDLNRNFPTSDWNRLAHQHWQGKTYKNLRRYPGEAANSEPETQWLVEQINEFQPDVIVSMHAPYHLVDYDGPPKAPDQLGSLYLRKLGVYPGSLGNYAGVDLGIPIVTVELASAGSMPGPREISDMWDDLVSWLRVKLDEEAQASN